MTFSILAVAVSVAVVVYAFYFVATGKPPDDSSETRKSSFARFAIYVMLILAAYSALVQWRFQREQNKQYRIDVSVLDSSNKPVSDATIWVANLTSKVERSSEGVLLVSGSQLPPDKTLQVFASSGYGESNASAVRLTDKTEVSTEIHLQQLVAIRGIVIDAEARPVPSATIVSGSQTRRVDENGTFSILVSPSSINRGGLPIRAAAPGLQPTERIYKVDSGPVTVVVGQPIPAIQKTQPVSQSKTPPNPPQVCIPPKPFLRDFTTGLAAQIPLAQQKQIEMNRMRSKGQIDLQIAGLKKSGYSDEAIARTVAPSPGYTRAEQAGETAAKYSVPPSLQSQIRELLNSLDGSDLVENHDYVKIRSAVESQCFSGGFYVTDCAGALTALSEQIK